VKIREGGQEMPPDKDLHFEGSKVGGL